MRQDSATPRRVLDVRHGDFHVRCARELATERTAEIVERAVGWTYPEYVRYLTLAARHYRAAGLGLLAGRVEWLAKQSDPATAWAKFDRLNAGGCGVA